MFDSFIKTVALVVTIVGALLTAFQVVPYNIYLGNVGALLYATWAFRAKDYNIAFVNMGLLMIYMAGTIFHHYRDQIVQLID